MPTPSISLPTPSGLNWLSQLGASTMKLGTARIKALLNALGNPQQQFKAIQLVGTNGKGSTAAILSSVYTQAGYKTGLATSPHILALNERIMLNQCPISDDGLNQLLEKIKTTVEDKNLDPPTYFEALSAAAMLYFAQQQVDVAIIEAGLGGRLDSTNVFHQNLATVITSIDFDHTETLGDTLHAITLEKVAISPPQGLIISTLQSPEAQNTLTQYAQVHSHPLVFSQPSSVALGHINWQNGQRAITVNGQLFNTALLGNYQQHNIALALCVIEQLQDPLPTSTTAIEQGLQHTQWLGRMTWFSQQQLMVDGSHNTAGLATLIETLKQQLPQDPIYVGVSLLQHKPVELLAPLLQLNVKALYCLALPDSTQSLKPFWPAEQLAKAINKNLGIAAEAISTDAFIALDGVKLATGSLYAVGPVLNTAQSLNV